MKSKCLSLFVLISTIIVSQACSHCCGQESAGAAADDLQLTGDWWGVRSQAAEHGVTVEADSTIFYGGVASGGRRRKFGFTGHNDYVVNMDMEKLGAQEGFFVKMRAEHRFGGSPRGATGALLPPYVAADLPVAESENIYLTNVVLTQMLSPQFGVFCGKIDTLDGDLNAFAHGRGKTQFSNSAMIVNPIALRTLPYSTLGAGFFILGEEGTPLFAFNVLNPTDTARTSGFDELFSEGVALAVEGRIPTSFGGLPGHQLLGGTWSSREYVGLDQDPRIVLPQVPVARQSGSWSLYWNFDQFLYVDAGNPKRGWGVFGRAGIADSSTNPLQHFLSFGVGGSSMICGRGNDTFGAGWYYAGTSSELAPFLANAGRGAGDGQGVELYYNIQVTPWFQLTPDLQIIDPARKALDTAVVTGLRGRVIY